MSRHSLSCLLVVFATIIGCIPSPKPKRIRDSTVTEIYDTWNAARCERDWELWFDCMTPQAREGEIAGLLLQSAFLKAEATERLETLQGDDQSELQSWIEELNRLIAGRESNERFVLEMKIHFDDPLSGTEASKCDPSKRILKDIRRTGDKAKAKCTHPGYGPDLLWFRRIDGKWRVDFEL